MIFFNFYKREFRKDTQYEERIELGKSFQTGRGRG
jgi:hypothetical protein